jgi:hypothetical protein
VSVRPRLWVPRATEIAQNASRRPFLIREKGPFLLSSYPITDHLLTKRKSTDQHGLFHQSGTASAGAQGRHLPGAPHLHSGWALGAGGAEGELGELAADSVRRARRPVPGLFTGEAARAGLRASTGGRYGRGGRVGRTPPVSRGLQPHHWPGAGQGQHSFHWGSSE